MECGILQWQWKIIKSITVLRFCKSEHFPTQQKFSGHHQSSHNPPLYITSYWTAAVMNPARRGEKDHHHWTAPRTDTNQCRRHVAHDMAKGIQISRVTSANITHSTKISAVNRKQLSSDIIDPYFYDTYGSAVSRQSHSWQSNQIWVIEALWHPKNQKDFILSRKRYIYYVTFLLMLITFWARAYPRDVLATCCCHTCQGRGKGDKFLFEDYIHPEKNWYFTTIECLRFWNYYRAYSLQIVDQNERGRAQILMIQMSLSRSDCHATRV
jgi:hypothetical protein